MRIGMLALGGWLVAAALTVGVSWSAISVVRDAVAAGPEVASGLPAVQETTAPARTPAATASTTPPRPGPTPTAASVAVATGQGGTAIVRCVGGRPQFVNLTPKQGYTVERDDDGTEVKFRSASGRTEITASCTGAVPHATAEDKTDGGGDDRGGGSGRGRGGDND